MIGTKMSATQNMIFNVSSLDVASHSVRLLLMSVEEGITNGNIEKPAVSMMPDIDKLLPIKAMPERSDLAEMNAIIAPKKPNKGAINIHEYCWKFTSQAPTWVLTSLRSGVKAMLASGMESIT